MVSTLGLTRSNGSVSHAGNSTTSPSGMYWREVVEQLAGVGAGGAGDHERAPVAELGERGDR